MSISLVNIHTKNIIHNDNSNEIIHQMSTYNDNSNDIENNDDRNILRIENTSLLEIFQSDRFLSILFMILGYYRYDVRDHIITRLLARLWQFSLLTLGGIGLCYQFILGVVSIHVTTSNLFRSIGNILYVCIIPVLQVSSLAYSLHMFTQQLKQPVKVDTISRLLPLIKRDACIFFMSMISVVIAINPININPTAYYAYYYSVDILKTYSLFSFQQVTLMFFNIAITCYLTVVLVFTSLVLNQVKSLQQEVINAVDANTLTCGEYQVKKAEISLIQTQSNLSIQIVTIFAGINIITFAMEIGFYHNDLVTGVSTYKDMILADLHMTPYLLKEIVFFYYVLLKVANINTLNCDLIEKINNNCWQLKMSENKDNINDYMFLFVDASQRPIMFKLAGEVEVRQNQVILTLVGFVFYCMSILIKVQNAV